MIGAPIAGAIYDIFGSYDISFYIGGSLFVSASFLSFTAQFLQQIKKKKKEDDPATQMWDYWKFNIYNDYNIAMWICDGPINILKL